MCRTYIIAALLLFAWGCSSSNSDDAAGDNSIDSQTDDGDDTHTDSLSDAGEQPVCSAAASADSRTAVTEYGAVRGTSEGDVTVFKAIPYAAPPMGTLRFSPPSPPGCYDGILKAEDFGPVCPQIDPTTGEYEGAEDCLSLNVWTPAELPAADGSLPVLVFIHGGGNGVGSARETTLGTSLYDGAALASAGDTVVVTFQYRLGALGWLTYSNENAAASSTGNFGLLDQIAALRWVKHNIAQFGGDPSRVMVFGQSAGAVDTCMLLVSPLAAGLFDAALMESGGCPGYSRDKVSETSETLIENAGCADAPSPLDCLRGLSAEAVVTAYPPAISVSGLATQTYFQPYVDGEVIPENPMTLLRSGDFNHVPFAVGANADETSKDTPQSLTEAQYTAAVTATFGLLAGAVLNEYPVSNFDSPAAAYTRLSTDAKFVCPSRSIAAAVAGAQSEPVFRYFFTQSSGAALTDGLGAFHGLELLFVFNRLDYPGFAPSADQVTLSETMMRYWTDLAAFGDPNGIEAPTWERYNSADDNSLILEGGAVEMQTGIRKDACDFWDNLIDLAATAAPLR